MKFIFHEVLYKPLYNILVGLIDILPHADIGLAVIVLTILVKIVLFPLSKKAIKTQLLMKEIEQPIKDLRLRYKDNPQELAQKTMELYKTKGINPFAGIFLVFLQLPVILALYFVFSQAGLPVINSELLYSFISVPSHIQTTFLGFIDLVSHKSVFIALGVLVTQIIQVRLSLPPQVSPNEGGSEFASEFMKGIHFQMKFILPLITATISYNLISVVGLYWIVGNIFSIAQELYFRKTIKNKNN